MRKVPFSINNGVEMNLYAYLGAIYEARRKAVEQRTVSGIGQNIILLESFGSTLKQGDWTDEDGIFLTYRLAPGYASTPWARDAAVVFEARLKGVFVGRKTSREVEGDLVHLYFSGNVHPIGD